MKAVFVVILLILVSCSHSGSDSWAFNRIDSGDHQFNSTKLTYMCHDPINGIDLEFMQTPDHLRTYLNVHSLPVPASKEDPNATKVHLAIGSESYQFLACRHKGGQRLLLPPEIAELIISGLSQNEFIYIKVPGYAVTIKAEGFETKFQQLGHTPLLRNPFHLPF